MDFPVEATVHLNYFPNKKEARQILRSHGLAVTDLNSDQVRVQGLFLKLKAAKASLEPLLNSPTKMDTTPGQQVSFGAVSKHYTNHSSDIGRKDANASSPSHTTRSFWSPGFFNNHSAFLSSFPKPHLRHSSRTATETFSVDADVLSYAQRIHKKNIAGILDSHNVRMKEQQDGDSVSISVLGKSAATASGKLQSLLHGLSLSLRTQEVPLRDVDHQGRALLEKIQKSQNISGSVVVLQTRDKLHLIGPSDQSYELKQRLLGRPVEQPGHTGRTFDRAIARRRSSSLPSRGKSTDRDSGYTAYPSPAGAAGYTPSKYQDVKQDVAELQRGGALESHENIREERATNTKMPKPFKKDLMEILSPKDMKRKMKSLKR